MQRLRDELKPLEDSVVKAMGKFLNANPEERLDLEVSLLFLPDFLRLLERIRAEDLPRFEQRFKERLNEKVGQEIGVLRGNLSTEKTHIEDRIQLLNQSLRQVPFGNGSHMRLVAREVRDPEIKKFQQDLDACVSGQFEGTLEADEARFQQIESLINKLRDEERWRLLITDVRNWFDFAAVETDDLTGKERSYHDDILRAEHTERRFKERLRLRCFTWRTPQGRQEFCGMLKKLDQTLPLAELSNLSDAGLAGRCFLACRGVPDYLMTLVRGAFAEALQRGNELIEMADFSRVFERRLSQQRVLAEQSNPFIGDPDRSALDRVQPADETRMPGIGLTPRAARSRKHRRLPDRFLPQNFNSTVPSLFTFRVSRFRMSSP